MARPSLADSLMASLNKGIHVETALKIAKGFSEVSEAVSSPTLSVPDNPAPPVLIVSPLKAAFPKESANIPVKQQTYEPDNEPVKYSDIKPAIEPDKQSTKTVKPDSKPVIEPGWQQTKEPVAEPDIQPHKEPALSPVNEPVKYRASQGANHPANKTDPELWYPYTEKQGRVLLYLIEAGGRTKREFISCDTGVNIATVKYALRVFVKDGFISPTSLDVNHTMRGFTYSLNPHLCGEYAVRVMGSGYVPASQQANHPVNEPVRYPDNRSVFNPVSKPVRYPAFEPASPFSSKVFEEKELTTKNVILNNPELRFWEGEGVSEKQVQNWMAEFEMTEEEIILSLRYGRFDILERGDVQNSANWFYKIVFKNGFYPKPANYRSMLEMRAEALRQQQEQDKAARAQIEASEFEYKFQAFLEDPAAPIYLELMGKISSFSKEQMLAGEKMTAEIELKELLKKYLKET